MHGLERNPPTSKPSTKAGKKRKKKKKKVNSAQMVLWFISKILHYAHHHIPVQTLKSSDAS